MMKLSPLGVTVLIGLLLVGCASTPQQEIRGGMDRISPVRAAEVNTRLGLGYFERGQLQRAMENFQTALRHDPEHVPAHLALALIFETIGNDDGARQHYRRAVRLAPNDGATLNAYAVFQCRSGDFAGAERLFMRAVADPFYSTPEVAFANAGACARRKNDLELAERHLRSALDLDPVFPDALYHLAEVSLDQDQPLRARGFFQRLESVVDSQADATILLLGYRIETRLNNQEQAAVYARRLSNNFPDSAEARELMRSLDNYD